MSQNNIFGVPDKYSTSRQIAEQCGFGIALILFWRLKHRHSAECTTYLFQKDITDMDVLNRVIGDSGNY